MKRWVRCAAWLYPASWRKRYAREFEALLDDAELRWTDFWDIVRGALAMQIKMSSFGKVVGAFGLAGLAIAAVVVWRTPSVYQSTGVMRVTGTENFSEELLRVAPMVLTRSSLTRMVVDGDIYKTERASQPLEDVVQKMRRDIVIRLLGDRGKLGSTAFSISFRYDDAAKAQWGARALLTRFSEEMPRVQSGATLEVLDQASLPERPFEPNRPVWVAVGLGLGLLAGSVVFGLGKWPRIAMAGFGTAFVVLIGSYFVPDRFISEAVLRGSDEHAIQLIGQSIGDPVFLQSVVQNPALGLYPGKPVAEAVAQMQHRDLRIARLSLPAGRQSLAVAVSFRYTGDRRKAQAVVLELVAHAMKAALADHAQSRIEVLDAANLPEKPFGPNRPVFAFLGLLGGMLLGVVWQISGRFRTPTLNQA
jgi:hypothetical protein